MGRWWRRRRALPRDAAQELARARVLVECHDEAAASSSVLEESGFAREDEVLLRHLMFLPAAVAGEVTVRLGGDGYVAAPALVSDPSAPEGLTAVAVGRVQRVDAHSVSRERSLIGSISARCGGAVGGWAVLEAAEPPA